jgi:formate-dependent phosphoribosylglycinamide formyltransferase (GAR transformylase)
LNIEWGLTHVEYFLDGDRIFLGEIAWRPPGGYLMDLISLAYGFDAWEAFLNVQLGLPTQFPDQPVQAAAAVLFHPGAGLIRHIEGVDTIQCAPNLSQFRLLCQVGRRLAPRTKVSNAAAYAIFAAPEVDTVLQSIVFARKTLRFNLIR